MSSPPEEHAEPCPRQELIEALAHGQLDAAGRRDAERLLEENVTCRELFRKLTAGRFPRLPNYTIIAQIGKGGFGVVYKAIHHTKERTEALKVLFSKTPLLTSYFQNEVHLVARLRHPNIATLFEAQLSKPPLYYTMEFVEGERLNEYLKQHPISLAERLNIIQTVANAIGYAHSQGVVHRDLKPQNILISPNRDPHIVDFGIAKKLVLAGQVGEISHGGHEGPVGTVGYIAPEQEKGEDVDARADIFALGALLFHSVTGEPARLARDPDQCRKVLRECQVPHPEDLAAIIARCVEDLPERRYASGLELSDDIENYLAGRPINAGTASSVMRQAFRIGAYVMRHHWIPVRAAALVLVAGFLTWVFWTFGARTFAAESGGDRTVMIGFTMGTVEAIADGRIGQGLPELNTEPHLERATKTWRALYGRLMERLAIAKPAVVAWDYFFPQCSDYDEYLIRGFDALRDRGVPVVLGFSRFDDQGQPQTCPDFPPHVYGFGSLVSTSVNKLKSEYEVAYCLQRGFFDTPQPTLALAAYCATRYPNRKLELKLGDRDDLMLYLRYRRPENETVIGVADEAREQKPVHQVMRVDQEDPRTTWLAVRNLITEGGRIAHARVPSRANAYWEAPGRTLYFEDVLQADVDQLREWFDGRAVVIGQMVEGVDQHDRQDGEKIFGCQVHADTLDALLEGATSQRFGKRSLGLGSVAWCALAVLIVSTWRRGRWRSLRSVTTVCAMVFVGGVMIGVIGAAYLTSPVALHSFIALTALLAAGSVAFWTKAVRERQLDLAPTAVTPAPEDQTLQSTVLAETR